jgi:hypothetical protein
MKIQKLAYNSCAWNSFVNHIKLHKVVNKLVSVYFLVCRSHYTDRCCCFWLWPWKLETALFLLPPAITLRFTFMWHSKAEQKSSLATRHAGTKRKRKYSSYSLLTSALDLGEWWASLPGRALPLRKGPAVPTGWEHGWVLELVWKQRLEKKSFVSAGDRTPVVQCVVRHCTDWATSVPFLV